MNFRWMSLRKPAFKVVYTISMRPWYVLTAIQSLSDEKAGRLNTTVQTTATSSHQNWQISDRICLITTLILTLQVLRQPKLLCYQNLRNGGELETAARIAGHDSTRTTQIYDRTEQELALDQIERILI